jgi:hypothetical protein
MNAVEEFDRLINIAQESGYRVRYDYFGGTGGGVCRFGGTQWLFVDLALSVNERLDNLKSQLSADPLMDNKFSHDGRAA